MLPPLFTLLAWLVPAAVFALWVPRAKRSFDEFGLALPAPTKLVLAAAPYWPALVPLAALAAAAAWAAAAYRPRAAMAVFALLTAPALLLLIVAAAALAVPGVHLAEGMSK